MFRFAALCAAASFVVADSGGRSAVGQGSSYPVTPASTAGNWSPAPGLPQWNQPSYQAYLPNAAYRAAAFPGTAQYGPAQYGAAPPAAVPFSEPWCPPQGYPAACDGPYAPTYGPAPCDDYYAPTSAAVWSVSAAGMLLSIDLGRHYNFSYDDAIETSQFTDWRDTAVEWDAAFEIVLRRFNACACDGYEVVYWQLFADQATTTTTAGDVTGFLNAILNFDQLDYNGDSGENFVNAALIHRLRHDVDLYNIELSRVICLSQASCETRNVHAFFGARLMRFDDQLQFAADTTDGQFGTDDDELFYDIDAENTLYGAQGGLRAQQRIGNRTTLGLGAKAGAFGNHINAVSRIGGAAGVATVNNGPNDGRAFFVDVEKDDIAMLAELEFDLAFAVTSHCTAGLGYRVIGVSGVALSVNQIFHDLRGLQDVEQVNSDGTLLLHGARGYVEWQF